MAEHIHAEDLGASACLREIHFELINADVFIEGAPTIEQPILILRGNVHHTYEEGILRVEERNAHILAGAAGVALAAVNQHNPVNAPNPSAALRTASFSFAKLQLPHNTRKNSLEGVGRLDIFSQIGSATLKGVLLRNAVLSTYSPNGSVIIEDTFLKGATVITRNGLVSIQSSGSEGGWSVQTTQGDISTNNIAGALTVTHPK